MGVSKDVKQNDVKGKNFLIAKHAKYFSNIFFNEKYLLTTKNKHETIMCFAIWDHLSYYRTSRASTEEC